MKEEAKEVVFLSLSYLNHKIFKVCSKYISLMHVVICTQKNNEISRFM